MVEGAWVVLKHLMKGRPVNFQEQTDTIYMLKKPKANNGKTSFETSQFLADRGRFLADLVKAHISVLIQWAGGGHVLNC